MPFITDPVFLREKENPHAPEIQEDGSMPEKNYRIGEAAELLNLKTHVLRFWET